MMKILKLAVLTTFSVLMTSLAFAHPGQHNTPCSYLQGKTVAQIKHPVLLSQLRQQGLSIHDTRARVVGCHESGKYARVSIASPLGSNSLRATIDTCGFTVLNGQPVYLPTGHHSHNYVACQPSR